MSDPTSELLCIKHIKQDLGTHRMQQDGFQLAVYQLIDAWNTRHASISRDSELEEQLEEAQRYASQLNGSLDATYNDMITVNKRCTMLEAQLAEREWQDISTAPKDGAEIDLYLRAWSQGYGYGHHLTVEGTYVDDSEDIKDMAEECYNDDKPPAQGASA